MKNLKDTPMNKTTLVRLTLVDLIAALVHFFWAFLALIIIKVSKNGHAHRAMISLFYIFGVVAFVLDILGLVVIIKTKQSTAQNRWLFFVILMSAAVAFLFISFIVAPFTIVAAFVFVLVVVCAVVVCHFLIRKFMGDSGSVKTGSVEEGGDQSTYEAPAAVDSEANPEVSGVESSADV